MNKNVLDFLYRILDSTLSKNTIEEIVRWYVLPRNTEIRSFAELSDEELQDQVGTVGIVKRPTAKDIELKKNPQLREELEETKNALDAKLKND